MELLGIIPARGGSKRLRGKNVRKLCDKPMLAYSIEAAKEADIFDKLLVSTEDEEIASIAEKYDAKVHERPRELASDEAQIKDVARYIINEYKKQGTDFDNIMILPPTSPLRISKDVQQSYEKYKQKGADHLISLTDYRYPPVKTFVSTKDDRIEPYWLNQSAVEDRSELFGRAQEHPDFLVDCVSIWIANTEAFLTKDTFHGSNCVGYYMPPERAVDVDDKFDFMMAEMLMNRKLEDKKNEESKYDLLGGRY